MEAVSMKIQKINVRRLSVLGAVVVGGLALSACASTDYVDQHISEVNAHISAVDAKASAADQKADQAMAAAQAAQAAAAQANQRIDTLSTTVTTLQQQQSAPPPRPRG
jgi:outer membrane murein-binding lipoprotein Lpp